MAEFIFKTDSLNEAALILEALGDGRPAANARQAAAPRQAPAADDRRAADVLPPEAPQDDPWAEDDQQGTSEPRRGENSRSAGDDKRALYDRLPRPGVPHLVETPNGDRYWTFEAEGAPQCECGLPAARQTPTERPGPKGFKWTRWACPLGFSKDTYKSKCSFSQFADKK